MNIEIDDDNFDFEDLIEYDGIGCGDETSEWDDVSETKCKKLLRTSAKQVDWAILIAKLRLHTGASIQEISVKSGIPKSTLVGISKDKGFNFGDRALALIDLFAVNVDHNIPMVGEYFEGINLEGDD